MAHVTFDEISRELSKYQATVESGQKSLHRRLDQLEAEFNRPGDALSAGGFGGDGFFRDFEVSGAIESFKKSGRGIFEGQGFCWGAPLRRLPGMKTVTSTTAPTPVGRLPEIVAGVTRAVRIRDLIPRIPVSEGSLTFLREVTYTNRASPVQETASKPPSAITFEQVNVPLVCIAHWLPASKQVLDDIPLLREFIAGRLLDGLMDAEDFELMFGDGTNNHMSGLDSQAAAYAGTYAQAGDTYIDKLGHALQELENNNYSPDGFVLNPVDWRRITLQKTEDGGANKGSYVLGGPGSTATPQLWSKPVALSTAQREGRFLVGQFAGSVALFDRMGPRIDLSSEHADYFVLNRVAIRCEERVALAVFRPAAFRVGNF